MNKLITLFAAVLLLASCNLDFYRSDTMTSSMLSENPAAAEFTTDGNYALLKDRVEYSNDRSDNIYLKVYFQMSEFRGDNICLSGRTTSPVYNHITYTPWPPGTDQPKTQFLGALENHDCSLAPTQPFLGVRCLP